MQKEFNETIFFLFKDVEKKNGAKEPRNSTPLGKLAHAIPPPKMRESRYFKPQPHPTMWLRRGPGCVALATREQSAPTVPKARLLHVELAHNLQFPGVPSHTQVREPQSAMRRQEQPPVQGFVESPQCNGGHEPE